MFVFKYRAVQWCSDSICQCRTAFTLRHGLYNDNGIACFSTIPCSFWSIELYNDAVIPLFSAVLRSLWGTGLAEGHPLLPSQLHDDVVWPARPDLPQAPGLLPQHWRRRLPGALPLGHDAGGAPPQQQGHQQGEESPGAAWRRCAQQTQEQQKVKEALRLLTKTTRRAKRTA